jgi:KUP system potassium uptake protein
MLAVVCILLVLTFRSSDRLASMYGLAVSATMFATDILFYVVATRALRWKPVLALAVAGSFALLDATFVLAGLHKFVDGAWLPLAIAAVISLTAVTWLMGRRVVARELLEQREPVEQFAAEHGALTCAPKGAVVLLSGDPTGVPFVNSHRWLERLVSDEIVILLTVKSIARPYVPEAARVTIDEISERFVRIRADFGYMETRRLTPILNACGAANLNIDKETTSFIFANPVIVGKSPGGWPRWRREFFEVLQRNSRTLAAELEIKASRQIALGVEVQI